MISGGTLLTISSLVATGILLAGVIDDLRSRKFHNWLFLVCASIALWTAAYVHGLEVFAHSTLGFAAGIGALLPFVLLRAMGAGDMKLLGAFGIIAGWSVTLPVAFYALIWGAVFGVLRAVVTKRAPALAHNVAHIVLFRQSGANLGLQKIPYTVAILFGWMTYLTIGGL